MTRVARFHLCADGAGGLTVRDQVAAPRGLGLLPLNFLLCCEIGIVWKAQITNAPQDMIGAAHKLSRDSFRFVAGAPRRKRINPETLAVPNVVVRPTEFQPCPPSQWCISLGRCFPDVLLGCGMTALVVKPAEEEACAVSGAKSAYQLAADRLLEQHVQDR